MLCWILWPFHRHCCKESPAYCGCCNILWLPLSSKNLSYNSQQLYSEDQRQQSQHCKWPFTYFSGWWPSNSFTLMVRSIPVLSLTCTNIWRNSTIAWIEPNLSCILPVTYLHSLMDCRARSSWHYSRSIYDGFLYGYATIWTSPTAISYVCILEKET